MALTYTYATGQITRDFHFKEVEGSCNRNPERTILIGVMCRTCPFYAGEINWYGRIREHIIDFDNHHHVIKCKFHRKDDPGLEEVVHDTYQKFEEEAITHYYD